MDQVPERLVYSEVTSSRFFNKFAFVEDYFLSDTYSFNGIIVLYDTFSLVRWAGLTQRIAGHFIQ